MVSVRVKVALLIITAFFILGVLSPILSEEGIIEKWNKIESWSLNPKNVPPNWYARLIKLPPSEWLRGENGTYKYLFTYKEAPQDIVVITNSTKRIRVEIIDPENRRYVLFDGYPYKMVRIRLQKFRIMEILREKCNDTVPMGNLVLKNTLNIIFSKPKKNCLDDPEFLHGEYKIKIEGDSNAKVFIAGKGFGILGTDIYGRDIWAGFVWGTKDTLVIGIIGAFISTVIGALVGTLGGSGKKTGKIVDGIVLLLSYLPLLPFASVFFLLISPFSEDWALGLSASPLKISIALGIMTMGFVARDVKSIVSAELKRDYVEVSLGMGGSYLFIIKKHVSKVLIPYVVYRFSVMVPFIIAILTLLGFFNITAGLNWGTIMGLTVLEHVEYSLSWWLVLPVGVGLGLLGMAFVIIAQEAEERFKSPSE
ncbi:ABC transporter permease subunit [Pyrococcus kukulkanii]|uniref:ABC transporter permease subunit n=1 Tax=Pyrococcus kukulkanii TaxID=1609559 RepID=UPI00356835E3